MLVQLSSHGWRRGDHCQPMWMPLSVKLWISTLQGCLHLSCSTADAPVARQSVDLNKKTSIFLAVMIMGTSSTRADSFPG